MSLQEEKKSKSNEVTEAMVVKHLQENPDFFNKHPDILAELKIPHGFDGVVSLVERQVAVLREQNQKVHKRLHELIEIAQKNEELARRMHQLALTLLDVKDPRDIFKTTYDNLKKNFQADHVIIKLFANSAFFEGFSTDEFVGKEVPEKAIFTRFIEKRLPLSGCMDRQQQMFFFGDENNDIASSVMIPLYGNDWCGILAIGSFDAERFQPDMSTELLTNLGEVLSFILKPWITEEN